MAKSSTKRKSKTKRSISEEQRAELEHGIQEAVRYVEEWKRKELISLAVKPNGEIPICVPFGKDAYLVGRLAVKKYQQAWLVADSADNSEFYFRTRSTAVAYALCEQTGHQKIAKSIRQHDSSIAKISEDIETYRFYKHSAKNKKDYWRYDYFEIMEQSAIYKLKEAKNQLEKSMHLAKYFKIW